MDVGGWKTRLSGRELKFSEDERFSYEEKREHLEFKVIRLNAIWKEWYKTIGKLQEVNADEYILEYEGVERRCKIVHTDKYDIIRVENSKKTKNAIEIVYYFKCILAKSQYCIHVDM